MKISSAQIKILLVSDHEEDAAFVGKVAARLGAQLTHSIQRDPVRAFLADHPGAIVFWDAESLARYEAMAEVLQRYVPTRRIFALTHKSLQNYPDLFNYQIFDHHLVRRFGPAAEAIASRVVLASHTGDFHGLAGYFPPDAPIKTIPIIRAATHRRAATEAFQRHLSQLGIGGRLPVLVAQALDELVLNAVFDAPVDAEGRALLRGHDRNDNRELAPQARVTVQFTDSKEYFGVAVEDHWGSLSRNTVLESLGKHYRRAHANVGFPDATAVGMGFRGIVESGVSLLISVRPKSSTRVMLFFPRTESFKEFRSGFQFVSVFCS